MFETCVNDITCYSPGRPLSLTCYFSDSITIRWKCMSRSTELNNEVILYLKKIMEEGEKPTFVVDGLNFLHNNKKRRINFKRLIYLCEILQDCSDEIYILLPEYFENKFRDSIDFQNLVASNRIFTIPSTENDDLFIIEFATKVNGFIISNDRFREFQEDYPIVEKMTLSFLVIEKDEMIHIIIPSLSQLTTKGKTPDDEEDIN